MPPQAATTESLRRFHLRAQGENEYLRRAAEGAELSGASDERSLVITDGGVVVLERSSGSPVVLDQAHALILSPREQVRIETGSAFPSTTQIIRLDVRVGGSPIGQLAMPAGRFEQRRGGLLALSSAALVEFCRVHHALTQSSASHPWTREERTHALLEQLARTPARDDSRSTPTTSHSITHRRMAQRARAELARSLAPAPSLGELARRLDTSPFHLARVFRAEVGLSVHQYLLRLRVNTALHRLRLGSPNLSLLALEMGFSHHSHFSVAFRRAVGVPPSDVRRLFTRGSAESTPRDSESVGAG